MLEKKGRLIAPYDPKMGHLSKCLDGGWGLPHPKIQMWNATKYKYVILLLEITHDSEKITKTNKRYNTYAIRQFTKKKTYYHGHLEVYDVHVFSRQTCNLAWLWCPVESSKQGSLPWADGNACVLCHRHPTHPALASHDKLGFSNIARFR